MNKVYTDKSIDEIKIWLKDNLDDERYKHSLGVMEEACNLAKKYNLDIEKARLAGLLHDCAKCFSKDLLYDIIEKNIPEVDTCELLNYKTLHAPVSAWIAMTQFNIKDSEILNAIRVHTIGKVDMTDFDKIIFLSDKIEPNTRDLKFRDSIYDLLDSSNDGLNQAILVCFKLTIKSLVDRNLKICSQTIDVYNSLL